MIINIISFEIRKIFSTPTAWVIFAISQFLLALLFYTLLSEYISQPAKFDGRGLTEIVVAGYYQLSGVYFVFLAPFLTMRLISEEVRSGTIRLFFSSPVSISELIIGKYFGALLFILSIVMLISLIPASLAFGTNLDIGHFFACVLGLVLLITTLTSVGLFVSTLFQHPLLAGVSCFASLILLWTADLAESNNALLNIIVNYLSLHKHYNSFTEGIFNTTDVFYFMIVSITFVALSVWRLDSMRTYHW
ncbi:MAG: ABC-2 type transport system permease protein [Gammaproteobacteria bacterium]|jgi:ABC-2 type transport system permease protein